MGRDSGGSDRRRKRGSKINFIDVVATVGVVIGEETGSNDEVANFDLRVAKCPVSKEEVSRETLLFRMF